MEKILTEGKAALPGFRELILQPQSDIPHFRHFLMEHGFCIIQEEMILEDGKYYPMMKQFRAEHQEKSGREKRKCLENCCWNVCIRFFISYLQRELRIREEISGQLKNAAGEGAKKRLDEVEEEKRLIWLLYRDMKVKELTDWLDGRYPADMAEHWDNVGLLVGDDERGGASCAFGTGSYGENAG